METEDKSNIGDKKWNNLQTDRLDHKEFNEGFSTENISPDFDLAKEATDNLRTETDIDEHGNPDQVQRARYIDADASEKASKTTLDVDNRVIENPTSLENRDRNYDLDPNRYPPSDPENHINRGNLAEE